MATIGSILSDPDMSKVTSLPPIKPKAGDVFVIESINMEDWKCDQYLWIRDGGRTIKVKDVEIGLYDPYSDITNNLSESYNAVLKQENDWKELPVDMLALGFHFLQNFDHYEILRGLAGVGDYHLKTEFSRAKTDLQDLFIPKKLIAPSDIISYLKTKHVNKPQLSSPSTVMTETMEDHSDSKTEHSKPTTSDEKDSPIINTMFDFPAFVSSQHALAKYIVDNNLITLVPSQGAFIVQGRNDWGNLSRCISRHINEKSKHHDNVLAATEFLGIKSGEKSDILESMSESFNARIKRNRKVLSCIIAPFLLCRKQNLTIKGHEEKHSNFVALLHMRAKDNIVLADHLAFADPQKKYTSPDIQNELIELCADQIISTLVQDCNDSKYFGFMSDEATDCSTKEQASICVRFFDKTTKSIREEFLGFAEASRTTGEALAELFLEQLELKGIDVDHMRAQGYDGAANMSGIHKGVQSRIKERIPGASYVHCKAHNLNLSIAHASEEPLIRNLMNTVQAIAFAFDYSAKRVLFFKESLEQNAVVREEMDNRQKLKTLCETRWASRSELLYTFLTAFKVIVDSLDNIEQHGDSKARSYACSIKKFDFIITLVATQSILQPLVPLSEMLQRKSVDLIEAVSESRVVIEQLNRKRNSIEAWDELFEKAVQVADTVEEVLIMPRAAGRQRHRVNVPAETPSQYWKCAMFLPFLDHLIQELTRRLVSNEDRFSAQYLIPTKLNGINQEVTNILFETFRNDINVNNVAQFREEVE
ncbi:unnamed protein product [Mytilus coruscus]|uniref:DUF4371 domain-containing protein n=1 Tax=Mytilus coruscus TaxID=42192 RepID=A0A6J8CWX8_MYTCO|nr:unnamed protein product [Mytilus coruscus]